MNSLQIAVLLMLAPSFDHDGIPLLFGKEESREVLRKAENALEDFRWRATDKLRRDFNKEFPAFLGGNLPVGPAIFIADRLDGDSDQWLYLMIHLIDRHKCEALPYLREGFRRYSATQKAHIYYALGRLDLAGFHDLAQIDASSSEEVGILNAPIGVDYTLGYFAKEYARTVPNR